MYLDELIIKQIVLVVFMTQIHLLDVLLQISAWQEPQSLMQDI